MELQARSARDECLLLGHQFADTKDRSGSAAPVRDSKMQPSTFDFLRVGICDPRMTAIAGLHFQTSFGERPFTGVDRSLARKIPSDAFGSHCADPQR